jgi:hypothetical protein
MNCKSPLLAAACGLLANVALANEWTTLSGIGDHVILAEGQTAMIVGTSQRVIVHFDKPGSNRATFRVESEARPVDRRGFCSTAGRERQLPSEVLVSMARPLPIAGPGRIEVRSTGVVSMQIVGSRTVAAR